MNIVPETDLYSHSFSPNVEYGRGRDANGNKNKGSLKKSAQHIQEPNKQYHLRPGKGWKLIYFKST